MPATPISREIFYFFTELPLICDPACTNISALTVNVCLLIRTVSLAFIHDLYFVLHRVFFLSVNQKQPVCVCLALRFHCQ